MTYQRAKPTTLPVGVERDVRRGGRLPRRTARRAAAPRSPRRRRARARRRPARGRARAAPARRPARPAGSGVPPQHRRGVRARCPRTTSAPALRTSDWPNARLEAEPARRQHPQRVAVADQAGVLRRRRAPGGPGRAPGRSARAELRRGSRRARCRPRPTSPAASRGPARWCGPPRARSPARRGRARPRRTARRASAVRAARCSGEASTRPNGRSSRACQRARVRLARRASAATSVRPGVPPVARPLGLPVPHQHQLAHRSHSSSRTRAPSRGTRASELRGTSGDRRVTRPGRPTAGRRTPCPWSPRRSGRPRRCRRAAPGRWPGRASRGHPCRCRP